VIFLCGFASSCKISSLSLFVLFLMEEAEKHVEAPVEEAKVETPVVTTSMSSMVSEDLVRKWKMLCGILALGLVFTVVRPVAQQDKTVVDPTAAAQNFIDVVNKVYAPNVANAKLDTVTEEHGLYYVKFTADLNGDNLPQETYLSKDGQMIIPRAVSIADLLTEFEAAKAAQPQGDGTQGTVPVDGSAPADGSGDTKAADQK
jgi:hypothetical protein